MPTVSVVTPFFNTAQYLAECVESVLGQTFGDFEYLLVDNASTDGSLDIARDFAQRDGRVRLVHFDELLPQIPNYNRALRLIDPGVRYCKMAQADDVLFPRCLEDMVSVADLDDRIGMVGAYIVLQDHVFLDGLDYYETIVDGDELCRRYLKGGPYIFGNPTSQLYRAADVREAATFFPEESVIADADAAVRLLLGRRFGFVHQVLSFSRRNNESISDSHADFNIDLLTRRVLLERYGARVLDASTFASESRKIDRRYRRMLGEAWLLRRGRAFWEFHRRGLADVGLRISAADIFTGVLMATGRSFANLEGAFRRLTTRISA